MKRLIFCKLILIVFFLLNGCKKEYVPIPQSNDSIQQPQQRTNVSADCNDELKDLLGNRMSNDDYNALDFSNSKYWSIQNDLIGVYQIPFTNMDPAKDFVLVAIDSTSEFFSGRILHVDGTIDTTYGNEFNGSIKVQTLGRDTTESVNIEHNYRSSPSSPSIVPNPNKLPEVIIVSTPSNAIRYSNPLLVWINILNYSGAGTLGMAGFGTLHDTFGYPGSEGAPAGGGGGGGAPSPDCQPQLQQIIKVELFDDGNEDIVLGKYFKCFDNVPSNANTTYNLKLYVDIPVNNNSNMLINFSASPGHVMIRLTKANGTNVVQQTLGFYPDNWHNLFGPVISNVRNDGKPTEEHEYNASFSMNVDSTQFQTVMNTMLNNENQSYDLYSSNNCADFALAAFNSIRSDAVSSFPISAFRPSANLPFMLSHVVIPRSPTGVYKTLQQMVASNHPEAGNIEIGVNKKVSTSHGECN